MAARRRRHLSALLAHHMMPILRATNDNNAVMHVGEQFVLNFPTEAGVLQWDVATTNINVVAVRGTTNPNQTKLVAVNAGVCEIVFNRKFGYNPEYGMQITVLP